MYEKKINNQKSKLAKIKSKIKNPKTHLVYN